MIKITPQIPISYNENNAKAYLALSHNWFEPTNPKDLKLIGVCINGMKSHRRLLEFQNQNIDGKFAGIDTQIKLLTHTIYYLETVNYVHQLSLKKEGEEAV